MTWTDFKVAAALVCLGVYPSDGVAATMRAVYVGTVEAGFDAAGLFGSAGSDLGGQSFTLAFSYDTAIGFLDTSSPGVERLWGGSVYPGLAAPVTARFTVNGQTQTISGNYQGYVSQCSFQACPAATDGLVQHLATEFTTDPVTGATSVVYASTFEGLFADIASGQVPHDLTQGYALTFDGTFQNFFDYFFFDVYDPIAGYSNSAYAYLNPTRLTVAPVVPVPVPAGGAGMLAFAVAALAVVRLRKWTPSRRPGTDRLGR